MSQHRIDYHCAHCGSRDVRRNADVRWNMARQEWEIVAVFDHATCEQCGGEIKLKEVKAAAEGNKRKRSKTDGT